MDARQPLIPGASVLASSPGGHAPAGGARDPYLRVAEIDIDPVQLEAYNRTGCEADVKSGQDRVWMP